MSSRILIVEDDRSFALQVKEVVDKHGHTALVAATGPAGIEMFERHKPDLLLVDVMLPGMTGIQVIERVRQLDSGDDVPILLMSAMYRSKDFFRDDMERLHLLEFLPKPFSLIDFGRRMDALLGEPAKGRDQVRELAGRGGRGSAPGEEKASASSLAARPSHPRAATDHTVSKSDGSPFETDALTPDRYVQLVSTLFGHKGLHTSTPARTGYESSRY